LCPQKIPDPSGCELSDHERLKFPPKWWHLMHWHDKMKLDTIVRKSIVKCNRLQEFCTFQPTNEFELTKEKQLYHADRFTSDCFLPKGFRAPSVLFEIIYQNISRLSKLQLSHAFQKLFRVKCICKKRTQFISHFNK
jgi:hypothetical protein